MKTHRLISLLVGAGLLALPLASAQPAATPAGSWKTIYYKRVFLGNFQASWVGGSTTFLRQPISVPFEGTRARAWLRSARDSEVALAHISLASGVNPAGGTDGRYFPLTFDGASGTKINAAAHEFSSDPSPVPLKPGIWYLQQNYTSERFLYTHDNDGVFQARSADEPRVAPGSFQKGSALGNVSRIDVFTASPQMVVACYGDSITQGLGATPGSGKRYPELLGYKINRPVLNLGVNGDLAKHSRGLPSIIKALDGVDSVVLMIGINDIITGSLASPDDYVANLSFLAEEMRRNGRKFYIGTIPPAGGYPKFDDAPAKEQLRQAINAWIRASSVSDGVIDFDAVLRDPGNPTRMRADCQSDWLHPNDAGYERMAEAAAGVIQ